jgi:hypothetical protein
MRKPFSLTIVPALVEDEPTKVPCPCCGQSMSAEARAIYLAKTAGSPVVAEREFSVEAFVRDDSEPPPAA